MGRKGSGKGGKGAASPAPKPAPAPAPAPKPEPAPAPAPAAAKRAAEPAPAPRTATTSRGASSSGGALERAREEEQKKQREEERKKAWQESHGSSGRDKAGRPSSMARDGPDSQGSGGSPTGRDHSVAETLRALNANVSAVRRPDDDARHRAARRRELEDMRSFALMKMCTDKGLDDSGGKPDMIRRILDFEAAVADGIIAAPGGGGENLTAMSFPELAQLARDEGVERDRIDECQDAQMPRAEIIAVLQEHRRSMDRQERAGLGRGGRPAALSSTHSHDLTFGGVHGRGYAPDGLSPPPVDTVAASLTLAADDFEGTVGATGSAERNRFEFDFREEMARKLGVDPSRIRVTAILTEDEAHAEEDGRFGGGGLAYDDDDGDDGDEDGFQSRSYDTPRSAYSSLRADDRSSGAGTPHGRSDGSARTSVRGDRESVEARQAALRKELGELSTKELRARCQDEGVEDDEIEEARDSDSPQEALAGILLRRHRRILQAEDEVQEELEELEMELGSMSNKDLRARALEEGIDEDAVEDARDADRPKEALVGLLMEKAKEAAEAKRGRLPKYTKEDLRGKKVGELRKMCQEEEQIDPAEVDTADEQDDARAALSALLLRLSLATGTGAGDDGGRDPKDRTRNVGNVGQREVEKTPDQTRRDSGRDTDRSGRQPEPTSAPAPAPKPAPAPAPAPKQEETKKLPPENYGKMKPAQLQEACRQRGLSDKGKKTDFIKRLQAYDSS